MTVKTMYRREDPETSYDAAEKIKPHLNDLQFRVLDAWQTYHRRYGHGASDGEIEALPQFKTLRPTTVRKRRLELQRMGFIRKTDQRRKGMTVYEPHSDAQAHEERQAADGKILF